ncbi:glycosyltransferase family 4 protein [Mycobacterium sp. CBMA247]|uniref:glycosyltransferase family 4 protein n=1 Tax=unclassified Mycolicibacterium TaxID=2636767 RepID=UPI0013058BD9|nr:MULTISPECIES: glycosyltransferase family 4 protein [unclassified Mycolicibacterium]MUL81732.1 glycosyltransferase family 4 protein [Mycolicibacterium sp. CBMA 329]MUL99637.1 glycosyltransferase family 4 protein [Mycolicibacterium sp. CBMA 334]MUM26734.1 glycosyltransferase family 4 protein [Mycolicibacterium sp. CBMA 295]MUM43563.1 glycosyltransferase family 4 protein [Mycolicibacterium sp. CBMA 294]MUL87498.1 glycosyltransferase family 4 protein [Mycolicibacterium sp. CBMA 331]
MVTQIPVRVLAIGPAPASPDSRGGMASVMRLLLDDPDPRFTITAVPTFIDAGVATRLWVGVRGMLTASVLILRGRTDVVHVHLAHGGSVVRKSLPLMVARLRGVPAIVHGHSFNFSGWLDPLPDPIRRLVRIALHADHWLVLGGSLAEQYRRSLVLPEDKVEVLYNPVVVPSIESRRTPASRPLTVLSLGRLGQRKGTYDLIQAVGLLPADVRAQLRIVLAGDGEVEQVRTLVGSRRLDDVVDVVGWVEPPARDELLGQADIFVLPSYDEGLPMAILEAMAHGVVPLSTPVGGIPEAITDGVDGLLVPPGEPKLLAGALERLATDDALRVALAAAARRRAETFDIAGWRARLATLWLDLTDRQPG